MRGTRAVRFILSLALITMPLGGAAAIKPLPNGTEAFNPSNGDSMTIPFSMDVAGSVRITLYTGDGDAIRTLETETDSAGSYEVVWDGKDASGAIVPNEAYIPVFQCVCDGGLVTVDPRTTSGGYPVEIGNVQLAPDGSISYQVPEAARVLVRVGIKGGALLRSLANWEPRTTGRHRQNWDGVDGAEQSLLNHPKLALMVRAFALPDHAIQTYGNHHTSYRAYREQQDWALPTADFSDVRLERDGVRIARESQLPISLLRNPQTLFKFDTEEMENGVPVVRGPITFRVDMAQGDKWVMQQSLYEVAFFLDYQFVSEEETGYTPLSWRWAGNAEPGLHTMTVNISGLWGQVGVGTVKFLVKE